MSWRAFADAQYDDASLASRFGYMYVLLGHPLPNTQHPTPVSYTQ